jgi:hypothetical protein
LAQVGKLQGYVAVIDAILTRLVDEGVNTHTLLLDLLTLTSLLEQKHNAPGVIELVRHHRCLPHPYHHKCNSLHGQNFFLRIKSFYLPKQTSRMK